MLPPHLLLVGIMALGRLLWPFASVPSPCEGACRVVSLSFNFMSCLPFLSSNRESPSVPCSFFSHGAGSLYGMVKKVVNKETDVNSDLFNLHLLLTPGKKADISGPLRALSRSEPDPSGWLGLIQFLPSGPVGQTNLSPLGFR